MLLNVPGVMARRRLEADARVGTSRAPTARTSKVAIMRGASGGKR